MNDPDLDEPIEQTADETEREFKAQLDKSPHPKGGLREAFVNGASKQERFQAKRWWFCSTAFPLIAGTFGPLTNLMSVAALVQSWRVKFREGGDEGKDERVPDPKWLLALNGLSLAFALTANVLLLLNFAQRVRHKVAMPIIVVFWYIASIILLVLVIVSAHILPLFDDDYAFSQSFYYGLISALLYFIISSLLAFHLLGAHYFHAYPASLSALTMPQRTLMLQTTLYAFYLAIGAGLFAGLEHWSYVDSLYYAHHTLLTVGLGSDFSPSRAISRALLIPYAFIGILTLGLIISSIRTLFLERGKTRIRLRTLDKERTRLATHPSGSPEEDFHLMRRVQNLADAHRKYWALSLSLAAFAFVWCCGALVFYFAERQRPQQWGYFDALYFSYTSLLTIGYGDLYPVSMAGKPFFVVWSMVAVPTMTVLISNMGDTVVGWVKEATLWVGRKTLLPEKETGEEPGTGEEPEPEEVDGVGEMRLVREVRRLAGDMGQERRYTWRQWEAWLRMLKVTEEEAEWSWLGDGGPLMSGMSETEWILEKMCERLEKVLGEEHEAEGRELSEAKRQ